MAQHQKTRQDPRIEDDVQVLVSNEGWKGFLPLRTRNVSAGGAFLVCQQLQTPTLSSTVTLKLGARSIRGRVAHVSKIQQANGAVLHGFGISFATPHPAWWTAPELRPSAPSVPVSTTPENPAQALFKLGMHHLQARSYQLAEQKFGQAFKLGSDPQAQAMQLVARGYQYLSTAFWTQATKAFEQALQLSPQCREAQDGLQMLEEKIKPKPTKGKQK